MILPSGSIFCSITFNSRCSINIRYLGSATLTWVNSNGGSIDTVKISTPKGGTVTVLDDVAVIVTVRDINTLAVIEDATVLLEADTGGDLAAGTDIIKKLTNIYGIAEEALRFTNDQAIR